MKKRQSRPKRITIDRIVRVKLADLVEKVDDYRPAVEYLCREIPERLDRLVEGQSEPRPATSISASNLGHPCKRFLYHSVKDWKKMLSPDRTLKYIFSEGKRQETVVINTMVLMGFNPARLDRVEEIRLKNSHVSVTMHMDAFWETPHGINVLSEIKSVSANYFETLRDLDNIKSSARLYIRKWYGQVQMYLYGFGVPGGIFLFRNKGTGEMIPLAVYIDPPAVEEMLTRAEEVGVDLECGTPSARISWDPAICRRCEARTICAPPFANKSVMDVKSPILETALRERQADREAHLRYMRSDKRVKEMVGDVKNIIVGSFKIDERGRIEYLGGPEVERL